MVSPFTNLPAPATNPLVDKTNESIARISSGNRFASAADDPAAIALFTNLSKEISGLQQATQNAMGASNMLRVADGGVQTTSDTLLRMRELAIQASNDTYSDADRGIIQKEMDSLIERLDRVAETTEFNGKQLLNGSEGTLTFQVGTSAEAASQIDFVTQDMSATALGVGDASVETAADAQGLIDAVDAAMEQVGEFRADIGAGENQLDTSTNNLVRAMETTSIARGRVGDTDLASESTAMATSMVQRQIQIAMRAQGNASSAVVMRLIG